MGVIVTTLRNNLAATDLATAGVTLETELDITVIGHPYEISATAISEAQASQVTVTQTTTTATTTTKTSTTTTTTTASTTTTTTSTVSSTTTTTKTSTQSTTTTTTLTTTSTTTSTTTTTVTTTIEVVTSVDGVMSLSMSNVVAFVLDTTVQSQMSRILADVLEVPRGFISAATTAVGGQAQVSYTVTLPSNPANIPASLLPADLTRERLEILADVASTISQSLAAKSLETQTTLFQSELDNVKPGYYVVTMESSTVPGVGQVTRTQTSTTATSTTKTTTTKSTTTTTTATTTTRTLTSTTDTTTTATSTTTRTTRTVTSTTTSTSTVTTTGGVSSTLDGSLTLTLNDPTGFVGDSRVQDALSGLLAEVFGVPTDLVTASAAMGSGNSVEVSYAVTFPPDLSVIPASLLPADMSRPPNQIQALAITALSNNIGSLNLGTAGERLQAELGAYVMANPYELTIAAIGDRQASQVTATQTSTTATTTTKTSTTTTTTTASTTTTTTSSSTGTTSTTTTSTITSTSMTTTTTTVTSTTTTTTTFTTTVEVITSLDGYMWLSMSNAVVFVADVRVQNALPQIVADVLGVPTSFLSAANAAMGASGEAEVSYTVTLPSNLASIASVAPSLMPADLSRPAIEILGDVADTIKSNLASQSLADQAASFQTALNSAVRPGVYTITLDASSVPEVGQQTRTQTSTTATTTTKTTTTKTTVTTTTKTSTTRTTTSTTDITTTTTSTTTRTMTTVTSTTTSTSTVTTTPGFITALDGSLTLTLNDPTGFVGDSRVQDALSGLLAEVFGVPTDLVTASAAMGSGNSVEVSYAVTFPPDLSVIPASLLPADMSRPPNQIQALAITALSNNIGSLNLGTAGERLQAELGAYVMANPYELTIAAIGDRQASQVTATQTSTTATTTTKTSTTTTTTTASTTTTTTSSSTGTTSTTTTSTITSTSMTTTTTTVTSTTTTTTTFTTTVEVITSLDGYMWLSMSNAVVFVADVRVQNALPQIVADVLGVPTSFLSAANAAMGASGEAEVSYTVTLPSNLASIASVAPSLMPADLSRPAIEILGDVADTIKSNLASQSLADQAASFQTALNSAVRPGVYTITLDASSVPEVGQQTRTQTSTTATTTTKTTPATATATTTTKTSTTATTTTGTLTSTTRTATSSTVTTTATTSTKSTATFTTTHAAVITRLDASLILAANDPAGFLGE